MQRINNTLIIYAYSDRKSLSSHHSIKIIAPKYPIRLHGVMMGTTNTGQEAQTSHINV